MRLGAPGRTTSNKKLLAAKGMSFEVQFAVGATKLQAQQLFADRVADRVRKCQLKATASFTSKKTLNERREGAR